MSFGFSTMLRRTWAHFSCIGLFLLPGGTAIAQAPNLVPDGTVPTQVQINPTDQGFIVQGGALNGVNLFHSFETFSPGARPVLFDLQVGGFEAIERIFSRVTGPEASLIDGLLQTRGGSKPDLFLLNPHGIVLGPNARLDLGGSFIATSAEAIVFEDGFSFATRASPSDGLLSLSVPLGLQLGQNPGAISLVGPGHEIVLSPPSALPVPFQPSATDYGKGLSLAAGNTLALVGNGLFLDGGTIQAQLGQSAFPQGGVQFSLGSAKAGIVTLQSHPQWGWALDYGNLLSASDIVLDNQTRIDGTGLLPSAIQVSGQNIDLLDGSVVYSQNLGALTNGPIRFEADGRLFLEGTLTEFEMPSAIRNSVKALGDGGDIEIRVGDLILDGGGNIGTTAFFGVGDAGEIQIQVEGDLSLRGAVDDQGFSLFPTLITSTTMTEGNSGGIEIETGSLTVETGALISSSALFGTGNSSDIKISARDSVLIQGVNPVNRFVSGIASSSFSAGHAGSIQIETPRLRLFDRGLVEANVYATGDAGNITIDASESVEIGGGSSTADFGSSYIASTAELTDNALLRQLFQLPLVPTGGSGSVMINTPSLRLFEGGRVSTTNEGGGDAGSLNIAANRLSLDGASLTASTLQGNGGNIVIKGADALTLRNGSVISASAGGQGNGGNIDIAADNIVARAAENSDITANAVGNAGGTIMLETSALLGLKVRPQLTERSDITASSELGAQFSGTVELVQPNTTPDSALAVLPDSQPKPVERLAQGCDVGEAQFNIAGRGGLPRSPLDLPELGLSGTGLIAQTNFQGKEAEPLDQLVLQVEEAIALRDQGFYPNALAQLEAIRQVKALATLPDLQSQVLRQLGVTHRLLGQEEEARAALEQSLAIAQKKSLPQATAATLLSLGHLAKVQGDTLQARRQYLNALSVEGGSDVQSLILASLMALEIEQQDWAAAKQWRQQLNARLETVSPAVITGQLYGVVVQLRAMQASRQPNPIELERLRGELEMVLTVAQQQQDGRQAAAYSLGYLGQLEELAGNWGLAQQYTEGALQFAQASADGLMAYQWAWQLGRIARNRWKQTGDAAWYGQSQGSYRLAMESLKSLRSDLLTVAPELQLSFRSGIEPVYREYVDLLLTQPVSLASMEQSERLQAAINTVEALRLAELDNYLQDACLEARPRSVAEIDGNAAVIYPIVLGDRLEVIVSLPQGEMRRYSQPVSQAELAQTVQAFRDGLVWRSQRDFREPGQQLYQWLIQPILEDLNADVVETVVFVPDGVLQNVPLAAISDGQEYLVEKFAIATAPGIELLPSQQEANSKVQTLVAGITQRQQGLAALPFVSQELRDVQAAIPGQMLLDEQFTRQMFADALADYDASIVHIATHGQFGSQASDTYIQAWDGKISLAQLGEILQRRSRQRLSPTELLVLSACETAVGDEAAALGLAGVAVRAGARSTLASLWSVNDQSTAALMAEFYQQLSKPDAGKAEALRQTQLEMLKDPVYRHPYYWSAFTLLGDWK